MSSKDIEQFIDKWTTKAGNHPAVSIIILIAAVIFITKLEWIFRLTEDLVIVIFDILKFVFTI